MAPRPLRLAPSVADTVRTDPVAPGVQLHTLVNTAAPWRAYVLDVDLRCNTLQAVKGATVAQGRLTTSQLLATLPRAPRAMPVAAVNADFFLFAPPGVPTNAHIERGTLISGPDVKPVFWRGDNGALGFDTLRLDGSLKTRGTTVPLQGWNRPAARTTGIVDRHWGVPLDTVVRRQAFRLDPAPGITNRMVHPGIHGRFVLRAARASDTLARGDTLLLHAPRDVASTLRIGDTVTVQALIWGTGPGRAEAGVTEAVGGRPILVTDSLVARDADTEGAESFRNLNPRTVMGLDRAGTRAWLAVIDGRQAGVSMGMTLRQSAELMRALGATRALNLDGGGSSALVLATASGQTRVVNRPSDNGTERAVANALAVLGTCRP